MRCGPHSITGKELEQAFDMLSSFECVPYWRFSGLAYKEYFRGVTKFLCVVAASVPVRHLRARNKVHKSLGQLLQMCVDGTFRSTERRDYIFALLSVSNDVSVGAIDIDYEKPLWLLRKEALPIIERSYISIDAEKRKSWVSFCQELDQLLGYSPRNPLNDDNGGRIATWLFQCARASPGTPKLHEIPKNQRAYKVQLGRQDYDTFRRVVEEDGWGRIIRFPGTPLVIYSLELH